MFRRALLAVAVLSCTFRESIYVHSENAQRLAIKDLICVLILSGGQKDNMGLDSQGKLLPSNLNIHVLNNESLQKKCLLNGSADGMNNEEMLRTILNSTSIQLLIKQLNNISIENFYSKNLTNKPYAINQGGSGNNIAMTRGRRTVEKDETDTNIQNSTTILIETVTDKKVIKYTNEKPNLENVITFWQTLAQRNKMIAAGKSKVIPMESEKNKISNIEINPNRGQKKADGLLAVVNNYIDNKDRIEGGYLKNMLPEYISKQSIPVQIIPSTTSASLVSDDDTDIFKYLLNSRDKESLETHNINAHLSKYSYEFNYSKIKYENKNLNPNKNIQDDIKPNVTNMLVNNNENFNTDELMNHKNVRDDDNVKYNRANSNYMRRALKFDEPRIFFINHSEHLKSNDKLKLLKTKNSKHKNSAEGSNDISSVENHDKSLKIQSDKQPTSAIPLGLIKQIAEDVKALILRDLHKDVSTTATWKPTTTTSTTTKGSTESTTTTTTTTTIISEKKLEKPHILEKILEILEKYKSVDESTVKYITHPTFRDTNQNTPKIQYHSENNAMASKSNMPYLNPYYPYKSPQSKKVPKLETESHKLIPFVPIRSLSTSITSFVGPKIYQSKPIMLQTNLLEIPPLSIALINPLPIANHDLIESTKRPFRPIQHQVPERNIKSEYKQSVIYKPNRSHRGDDTPRSKNLKRIDNKKNSEKVHNKISSVINVGTESNNNIKTKKINKNGHSRYRTRTENNVKRLREKLEHITPRADYKLNKDDCCKDEIFTDEEQHHPVDDIKTRDEASFKNLLRTQQRVTDMLALMLARTKDEQPLSVETA